MWVTDRSRYETYITKCQFKRWLQYHAYGHGIVPVSKGIHLEIGIAVHEGIRDVLMVASQYPEEDERVLEDAIFVALRRLDEGIGDKEVEFRKRGWLEEGKRAKDIQKKEAHCLVEALLRAWWMVEYPKLIQKYDIIGVEEDINASLVKGEIILMSSPDAILREKKSGVWAVYSIKTARNVDERLDRVQEWSMQNYTEIYAAYRLIKGMIKKGRIKGDVPKQWMIRYCNLIKGGTVYDEDEQMYRFDSPWVRYWKKNGETKAQGPERIALGKWIDNQGNKKGIYWKGYDKKFVYQLKGGVKKYFEMLEDGRVNPGLDLVRDYVRSEGEKLVYLDEVREQMEIFVAGELEVREKLKLVKGYFGDEDVVGIRKYFPRNWQSCGYPAPCEMLDYCDNPNMWDDPWERFEKRKPHHGKELELIQIKEG